MCVKLWIMRTGRAMWRSASLGVGTAVLMVGVLVGCVSANASHTAASAAHTVTAHATDRPTASASPVAGSAQRWSDQFEYLPAAGTVLATGRLQDVSGHASGDVSVSVASDLRFQVTLSGYNSTAGSGPTVALSVDRFGTTDGAPTVPAVDFPIGDLPNESADQVLVFDPTGRRDRGDLSYFNSLELVTDGQVVAAAPLTWTIPGFFPGLVLRDSGAAPSARGIVTDYQGSPASYAVWGDDSAIAVAKRFGITVDQLLYLNPQLRREDVTLLRDSRLNLSVAYR